MPFNLNTFKSQGLQFGGARPTLFDVVVTTPAALAGAAPTDFELLCQAANLPAMTVDPIEVPYFGRKIKVHGDRTFAPWTVTVMNDEDFAIRAFLERWNNAINTIVSNLELGDDTSLSYQSDLTVTQYVKTGGVARSYSIIGAWPSVIEAIDLGWDRNNQVETYNVTFEYDWWIPLNEASAIGSTGSSYAGDTGSTAAGA